MNFIQKSAEFPGFNKREMRQLTEMKPANP